MNPKTTCQPRQTATAFFAGATATATAAGAVSWSFASPPTSATPQHPAPRTSSAASMIVVPGPMVVVQRYEYTGRELASESSGYYFRYRVYGPALGQFFTRDPIGYEDGMALYAGVFSKILGLDSLGRGSSTQYDHELWDKFCKDALTDFWASNKKLQQLQEIHQDKCKLDMHCGCCEGRNVPVGELALTVLPEMTRGKPRAGTTRVRLCSDRLFWAPGKSKRRNIWEAAAHEITHFFDDCSGAYDPYKCQDMPKHAGDAGKDNKCFCASKLCVEMRAHRYTGACTDFPTCWELVTQQKSYRTDTTACQGLSDGDIQAYMQDMSCRKDEELIPAGLPPLVWE